ncbi:hypothetical protein Tco_0089848 [Tanacetum coccineum]
MWTSTSLVSLNQNSQQIVNNDALKLESNFPSKSKLNSKNSLDIKTTSPESNYKTYNSKKDKFDLLNIAEDLVSYEILSANNLKLDEGSNDDEVGIKLFSIDPPSKPLGDTININVNTYESDETDVTSNKHEGKSETYKHDFDWFNYDIPLKKEFDEFCKRWWGKEGMKDGLSDGSGRNYVPNDKWKHLEFERNNPIRAKQDFIGEYGLSIGDNDFEYMCDYLLSKDGPFNVTNDEGKLEVMKYKLIGRPFE